LPGDFDEHGYIFDSTKRGWRVLVGKSKDQLDEKITQHRVGKKESEPEDNWNKYTAAHLSSFRFAGEKIYPLFSIGGSVPTQLSSRRIGGGGSALSVGKMEIMEWYFK
jgi:hypothetical protein